MSLKVKILLAVNLLVCLAMLMSYLAPHIDPQKYWVFSFLVLFILCWFWSSLFS